MFRFLTQQSGILFKYYVTKIRYFKKCVVTDVYLVSVYIDTNWTNKKKGKMVNNFENP